MLTSLPSWVLCVYGGRGPASHLAVPEGVLGANLTPIAELLDGDAARLDRERCTHLGRLTGVDAWGNWTWGFVERLPTGLGGRCSPSPRPGRSTTDECPGVIHAAPVVVLPRAGHRRST